MKFHEKSLELNITHELLNLADSWYWFLTDIPLWRYWRPRYRLPFLKCPPSTAGGFHITTEGKDDPTGNAGGGFDVRIRTGSGSHLLFIQYKQGDLSTSSPGAGSEFDTKPHDHFIFEINGTKTNQHFVLRNLANNIGKAKGNAVVYALPLIEDMNDLESKAGKLLRYTKFISIAEIDAQALKNNVAFKQGEVHNFRIGKFDMDRCEVNFFFFFFFGKDKAPDIIADIIGIRFQKNLSYFISEIEKNYKEYHLFEGYIPEGIHQAFIEYLRYLLHYFEVSPSKLIENEVDILNDYKQYFDNSEFSEYQNRKRDLEIVSSVFNALSIYADFFKKSFDNKISNGKLFSEEIPQYETSFLIPSQGNDGWKINFKEGDSVEGFTNINYLVI